MIRAKKFDRICLSLFVLGWANFMVFGFIGMRIGGEAIHGKIEDGHYYLATGYLRQGPPRLEESHQYIEVSADVFQYSRIHGYSVLVTLPLGLLACSLAVLNAKNRKHEPPKID